MLSGRFVIQTPTKFIVLKFDYEKSKLPRPTQQRSVLIKNVVLPIIAKEEYSRDTWRDDHHTVADFNAIRHFLTNRNNHTASSWNNIRNTSSTNYIDRKKVIKVKEIWKDIKRLRRSVSNFKYGKS